MNTSQSLTETFNYSPNDNNMTSLDISSSTNNTSSFFDQISNISIVTWVIIIIVLAFLGFNVFQYLAYGTQEIADFFGPFTNNILGIFGSTTAQTIDVATEGTRTAVNVAADTSTELIDTTANIIDSGLDRIQSTTNVIRGDEESSKLLKQELSKAYDNVDIMQNNALNQELNRMLPNKLEIGEVSYKEDDANSNIQYGNNKTGFCFIGNNNGTRACVEVGVNDQCMSEDIYPSRDICINPNLRQ